MSTLDQKIQQLEEATTASQTLLLEKESKLSSASDALDKAKSTLKSLSASKGGQLLLEDLKVTDTELPNLISAKMLAQEEYDEAEKLYETNQKYLSIIREKVSR